MASLKYSANSDLQTVTLGSSYTAGAGSLVLTGGDGAKLPSTGDFWLRSVSPYVCFKVTARSTDTLTVVAGEDGTSDQNLSAGATLHWVLGVAAFDQFRQDICQTGAYASASAAKAGALYLPNNGSHILRDTGAAFAVWGPVYPCTIQDFSGFTQVNAGSASYTQNGSLYTIEAPVAAGDNIRGLVTSTPSTPYTLTMGCFFKVTTASNSIGLGWRESGTGKLDYLMLTDSNNLNAIKFTNPTTWSATRLSRKYHQGHIAWFRIKDDGTDRFEYVSVDGYHWILITSFTRTDFFTPDQMGVFVNAGNTNEVAVMSIFHWKVT